MSAASTYPVWGWGRPEDEPSSADLAALRPLVADQLALPVGGPQRPQPLAPLPDDRVSAGLGPLAALASADPLDRARHGLGRSYRDVVRGIRGRPDHVPDAVLRPGSTAEVTATLEWCTDRGVAVVPYAGGTSVVGGVEPDVGDAYRGVVSLDLTRLTGIVELDTVSRAALVRAGTTGPDLEAALRPHGLTARFYPQSFERSTVGGWAATRAAGHFSTGPTHIDDLVESLHAVSPVGEWTSRRLPASGAGPSPDRLLLGSEGSFGVITDVWLRLQPRPTHRWSATFAAPSFGAAVQALRSMAQSGLNPATCRVLDAGEATVTGTLGTGEAVLVVGAESWSGPVDSDAAALATCCRDAGLRPLDHGAAGGAGDTWRSSFLRAPYLREQLVLLGLVVETFETATTWSHLEPLVNAVRSATAAALAEVCGAGVVTCRTTHAYPDGAAPYFTVIAPARAGDELAQWAQVKAAATEAVLAAGGTVTHHHAVGRDHMQWYQAQMPEPFARGLAAVKRTLDPSNVLNPGVLVQTAANR